jgi:PAS domain S-box-containing protein
MNHEFSTSFEIPGLYFTSLFEALPGNCILLQNDAPRYTVLAATPEYLEVTGYKKDAIIGKGIFEVFPANANDPTDTGASDLRHSLDQVRLHKKLHQLPAQRYDVAGEDGRLLERYWRLRNKPALSPDGQVMYIIHTAEDITVEVKAERKT